MKDIYFNGANITRKYLTTYTEERKNRNGYDENVNFKSKARDNNKSAEKMRARKTKTCVTNIASSSYLNNTQLLSTTLRKYSYKKLVTDQLSHINRVRVEMNYLMIITESLGPRLFVVGGSQTFGRYGAPLDNTISQPPLIHSDKWLLPLKYGDMVIGKSAMAV